MRAVITTVSGQSWRTFLLFAMVVFAPVTVEAQTVTLAWDVSTDPAVVGYTVHVGISAEVFGQTFDVPGPSNTTFTFTQVVPGQRYYFAVSAYDAANVSSAMSNRVSWKLNVGPTLAQPLNQTSISGTAASLQLSATDDGDPLTYAATGLPAGMSINTSTGRISGTPTVAGSRTVTVSVSDGPLSASRTFTWLVTAPVAPISLSRITSSVASPRPIGTAITFTAVSSGGATPHQYKWLLYDGSQWSTARDWATGAFTWTPSQANANYRIGVWARPAGVTADINNYNMSVPYVITGATPTSPLSVTSLTSNLTGPRSTGTAITFTATATGGAGPYQYKWWLYDGVAWSIVGAWSSSATFTWTPTHANANYRIGVWVRNAGVTADVNNVNMSVPFPISGPTRSTPLTITGLTSNLGSPRVVGTSITFTAAATGGTVPYQYKFWVYDGSTWSIARDWDESDTYTWTPVQASLYYRIGVWVRDANVTTNVSDVNVSVPYPITQTAQATPITITALTSNVASPQLAGTPITFTTTVSGGTAPYQFKWWIHNGATWSFIQNWTGSNSFTWTPLQANANYRIGVWVRNSTTTADVSDVNLSVPYSVTEPGSPLPLLISALTTSISSPQRVGTPVTFTVVAGGGAGSYHYKWWLFDGTRWTISRDWSPSSTFTWTPVGPNANYRIGVWVREASMDFDYSAVNLSVPFPIVP